MSHINRKRPNTRLQIIQLAARLFIEEGYSCTTIGRVAKTLDLSTGNITFYFPSKEHMLAVLVDELLSFQIDFMERAAEEGKSSLLAYCLDLSAMTAICEEDLAARDFFTAAYSLPMTLDIIRGGDTVRTRSIFDKYRPDWSDTEWRAIENIVSGIEFSAIMTREESIPLPVQIRTSLDAILSLYGVPEELRRVKIDKVLAMDYRALGRRLLHEFKEYIDKVNEENLKNSTRLES